MYSGSKIFLICRSRLVEKEASTTAEKTSEEEETDETDTAESLAEEEVELVTLSLEEITRVYVHAGDLIVSKVSCLFVNLKFAISQKESFHQNCLFDRRNPEEHCPGRSSLK